MVNSWAESGDSKEIKTLLVSHVSRQAFCLINESQLLTALVIGLCTADLQVELRPFFNLFSYITLGQSRREASLERSIPSRSADSCQGNLQNSLNEFRSASGHRAMRIRGCYEKLRHLDLFCQTTVIQQIKYFLKSHKSFGHFS